MDINDKMLSVFKSMINDIIEVYTDKRDEIKEKYNEIIELEELVLDDCELIDSFIKNIDTHSKKITNKDKSVLEEDIIPGIRLNELWETDISDINKNNIWKYLQTFCIININLNSSKELQELLSGESNEIDKENKKDIKDLKKIKKLKNSIDGITQDNKELE